MKGAEEMLNAQAVEVGASDSKWDSWLDNLPAVREAENVLIVASAKDVETARAKYGLVATCNPMDAGGWRDEYSDCVAGKNITIIGDDDNAEQFAQSCYGKARSVAIAHLPPGIKELSAYAQLGFSRASLLEILHQAPPWKPGAAAVSKRDRCDPCDTPACPKPLGDSPRPKPNGKPNGHGPVQPATIGAVLRCASDIQERKLGWLWPKRIPLGKLTLFAGDPDQGKSAVTIDIASRVTRGKTWPDGAANGQPNGEGNGPPGSVIILSAEDDAEDTLVPRLRVAGADLRRVHFLTAVKRLKPDGSVSTDSFTLVDDVTALQDAVVSLKDRGEPDVRLVILDPISAFLGNTDSHMNSRVRGVLAPLVAVAQTLHFAVIALDHFSKAKTASIYRPNGSIAFTAAARASWVFGKDQTDPKRQLMLRLKLNLAKQETKTGLSYRLVGAPDDPDIVTVEWGEEVTTSAEVLQPEDFDERNERLDAVEWLKDELANGPVPVSLLKKRVKDAGFFGLSARPVQRAKGQLGVRSIKGGFSLGWSWQMPQAAPEGAEDVPAP